MKNVIKKKDNRFIKDVICCHPQHNAPMHLYIPFGQVYQHICPGCKHVVYLKNQVVTM